MDILVTDKTGTLTEGRISFTAALPVGAGIGPAELLTLGLLATEAEYAEARLSTVGLNPLDAALWESPDAAGFRPERYERLDVIDFDHQRRRTSVLVREANGPARIITKGSPEDVLALCVGTPADVQAMLDKQFDAGSRVVAVGTRPAGGLEDLTPPDEKDLVLAGFLIFLDRPKANARASLDQLEALGITVKIATGDNARVAEKVCDELGVLSGGTLSGAAVEAMSDPELAAAAREASIFARVSPEQKARIIRLLRLSGGAVGFMGDGVNDALALHAADIGISVDSATDVAKDAADVVLLEKSLDVLADGVAEGRRIFANTIKYVLMGTSSNFGNMFSAAAASGVLSFLPMLPSQILLNNLLYDAGQLTIPTDNVDPEQLRAPSHWDIAFIRRFMLFFGPLSSLFDFLTFGIMLGPLHAGPNLFRSGWFVESLATQALVIFAIRTRRIPFLRSVPSAPLAISTFVVVVIAGVLPLTPLARVLGFVAPPITFYAALVAMVAAYLVLVELGKRLFFGAEPTTDQRPRRRGHAEQVSRRAARFGVG
jgi:Mg2+-importing ATPase